MKTGRQLLAICALCSLSPVGWTAEPTKATDDDLRIRGVFETPLPGTEAKKSLRLILHPHLGDLRDREYLRTAVGFRYGVTENWETVAEVDYYFSHGVKEVDLFRDHGFSTFHLGTKYLIGKLGAAGWDTSVGVDFIKPVGSPPAAITDGLQHLVPYVALSRQLVRWPDWRTFFGLGYDFVSHTSTLGERKKNQLTDDFVTVSGGLLWARGPVTYALESTYATMLSGRPRRDVFTVRPGFVWVLPPQYTFGSKGKCLLGVALWRSEGADGSDTGVSAKLRVNFDFRRLLGRPAPAPTKP